MPWLLIVVLHNANPSVAMMRFPNKESCERAQVWYDDHAGGFEVKSVCLADSSGASTDGVKQDPDKTEEPAHLEPKTDPTNY